MEELWMLGTAIVIGLASLKLIPAKKLSAANKRMRNRFSGKLLAVLYVVFWILLFVGAMFICIAAGLNKIAMYIILGVILGLFVGFIPIVDKRNAEEDEEKPKDEDDDEE